MEISGFVKLSDLVDGILYKDKKLSKNDRNWIQEHLIDGIRHFNMHDCYSPKQLKVIPDSNGIINYPTDMVGFISLNFNSNGEFITVPENTKLSISTSFENGDEIFDIDKGEGVDYNDGLRYGLGTSGGKGPTYYVRDEKKSRILLNGAIKDEYVMLYVSAGVQTESETYISVAAKLLLESYTRLQVSEWGDGYSQADIQRRQLNYEEHRRLYRTFKQSIILEDLVDSLCKNYGMLPQR